MKTARAWVAVLSLSVAAAAQSTVDDFFPTRAVRIPGQVVGVLSTNADVPHSKGWTGQRGFENTFSTTGSPCVWVWVPGPGKWHMDGMHSTSSQGVSIFLGQAHMPPVEELPPMPHAYVLISAVINQGQGSMDNHEIHLSHLKVMDGTPGYPADTGAVVQLAESGFGSLVSDTVVAASLQQANSSPETGPPGVGGPAWLGHQDTLAYATWFPDRQALEIRCRRLAGRTDQVKLGTRRVLVRAPRYPFDPVPGQTVTPPPPPPDHWETVDRLRHVYWGTAIEMTFTWHAGNLTHTPPVPHLYHYHQDDPDGG